MALSIDEIVQRRAYNAAADLIDGNVARGLGGKVAFIDPERTLTYGALQARSCQFARALKTLGIRQECRVALLLLDTVDFPVAFFGAIRAGVVALPLNILLTEAQYAYVLADSRACAIVVQAALAKPIAAIVDRLPELTTVILVGATPADKATFPSHDVHLFEDVLARESAEPCVAATNSDEVAFWMYTSGSTGDPKGVKHVQTTPAAAAALMGRNIIGIREDDVVFSAAKLFFSYGMGNALAFPMSVGASTVLWPHRPTPDAVFEIMRQAPSDAVLRRADALRLDARAQDDERGRRLRSAAAVRLGRRGAAAWRSASAGARSPAATWSTASARPRCSRRISATVRATCATARPASRCRATSFASSTSNGRDVADGEIGELLVRGPTAGEGYWNQRAKSRRTFAGEWTHSGDKFYRDTDGYYYYCGRTDDMFKVSGMWVSPFEVEAALMSHEAVFEAAVIGKEDADGLIKPKAFIVLKDGYTADDSLFETLRVHVKERAGPWKFPRWIDVRDDLPRTATGKIQRFKLRDMDAAHP